MIPYADLAAALEQRDAAPGAAPLSNIEDTTLSGAQLENQGEYELADDLAEEDNG